MIFCTQFHYYGQPEAGALSLLSCHSTSPIKWIWCLVPITFTTKPIWACETSDDGIFIPKPSSEKYYIISSPAFHATVIPIDIHELEDTLSTESKSSFHSFVNHLTNEQIDKMRFRSCVAKNRTNNLIISFSSIIGFRLWWPVLQFEVCCAWWVGVCCSTRINFFNFFCVVCIITNGFPFVRDHFREFSAESH